MSRKLIGVLVVVCLLSAALLGAAYIYEKYRVTQPIPVAVLSAADAEKYNIDFLNRSGVKVYRHDGIADMRGEPVSKYVQSLGYSEEEARCAFALKGYSVARFEPQDWHGVYLTIFARKEKPDQVHVYLYDPRYAGAWHLRHYAAAESSDPRPPYSHRRSPSFQMRQP